jgi:DNA ligase 1
MKVSKILTQVCSTRGTIAKSDILKKHIDNNILRMALKAGMDSFTPFNIVKVPKVKDEERQWPDNKMSENDRWAMFFNAANSSATRKLTGNVAIRAIWRAMASCTPEEELWMRKILQKRVAIGVAAKSINKVWPNLIPIFEVSLAQKFHPKRIEGVDQVFVEPKLDGIRCFAIVENGEAKLFARSGKLITNFDSTIGSALVSLGDGCYDGELMGKDFIALMRQAYRKENVDQEGTYISLFDFLPLEEWRSSNTVMTTKDRYEELTSRIDNCVNSKYVKPVERYLISAETDAIMKMHDTFVSDGYEGAMVKTVTSPYQFSRSYDVMKVKSFFDADLVVEGLDEGTGRHKGRLGAVVVNYLGTKVNVGSGFTDELRELVWNNKDEFIGRMVEVRYQEVTQDGSLRFPTFVCFRNDR